MAHIDVDKRIINNVNNDNIIFMLNQMIDEELSKDVDKIDTVFVDQCVDALLQCEKDENNFAALVPLASSEKFLKKIMKEVNPYSFKNLNVFARTAVVAALIAGGTFTANASVEAITNVNIIQTVVEKIKDKLEDIGLIQTNNLGIEDLNVGFEEDKPEETTTEKIESTTVSTTAKPAVTGIEDMNVGFDEEETTTKPAVTGIEDMNVGFDDDETTTQKTTKPSTTNKKIPPTTAKPIIVETTNQTQEIRLTGIDAQFENFKTDYIYGEELSYDGLTMTAVFSDGSSSPLSLDECDYTKAIDMNKTADYTLRIIYKSCEITIDITVRPDEDTRGSQICSNDEYDYLLTDSGVYVTAYKGSDTVLEIDEIDGVDVIAIGAKVFMNSDVQRVYAQNAVKIFASAFEGCSALTECYVPNAVYIGDYAFSDCTNLTEAIFSEKAEYLGEGAYRRTAIEYLDVPENVTEISPQLCRECPNLTEVNLLGDVTDIGASAFEECESLEIITGCGNIEHVGDFAFYYDEKLKFDVFPQGLVSVGDSAFYFCQKLEIGYLPSAVERVSANSFAYCLGLTGVTIPDTMKVVPRGAFMATNAKTIIISEGVTEVKESAFEACKATSIELPNSLKVIGDKAFYTVLLRNVSFGYRVASIGVDAFYPSRAAVFKVYDDSVPMQYCIDHNIRYTSLGKKPGLTPFDGIESLDGGWD
ncbi:MAG: leucine-rich repeat protein [Clostridium sp.]|nr:leucine-rich repeat protein [Clostridium sp.]